MPASHRALPQVWPALRTSSSASSSTWASTTAANRRSTVARSPGDMARQAGNAACAASIAASVSSTEARWTSVTGAAVAGLMTVYTSSVELVETIETTLEAAAQAPSR